MGIAERKEREKKQRRQAIIDAAERVFFSKSFELATMDEIAEECELSKGTIYLYFKDKEELYLAVNERGHTIMAEMLEQALENDLTGSEQTRRCGEAYLEFAMKHTDYFKVMMSHEKIIICEHHGCETENLCQQKGRQSISCLVRAIQAGAADGSIKTEVDPYKLALVLWGSLYGVIQLYITKGALPVFDGIEFDDFVGSYFRVISEGFGN